MNEPQDVHVEAGGDGTATLTDEEITTRRLHGAPRAASDDSDTGDDSGDTGDDSGDTTDTTDTGDDSGDTGDTSDTGDDSGDSDA